MGSTEKTTEYQDYVDYTMERLGFSGVVDDSTVISEFIDPVLYNGNVLNDDGVQYLAHLKSNLGVVVHLEDHIWEVAAKVAMRLSTSD